MEPTNTTSAAPKRGRGRPRLVPQDAAPTAGLAPVAALAAQNPVLQDRPEQRPAMRSEMRSEDPRAAAERRAAEIMGHLGALDEGTDEFYIPKEIIPDGWTYEWKRRTVYGKEDPAYQVQIARTGWAAVPAARHPEMMPIGGGHATIDRKGMVLMERPEIITKQVVGIEAKKARDQVRSKEAQLSGAPDGQFSRTEDPRTRPNIKKSYEAIPIPADATK